MANTSSAKGNPASKRMSNPKNKEKGLRNKLKNERLREKGEHPKQIRDRKNRVAAELNAFMIEHYIEHYGFQNRKQVHAFAKRNPAKFLWIAMGDWARDEAGRERFDLDQDF